jgi:hypothetical protein
MQQGDKEEGVDNDFFAKVYFKQDNKEWAIVHGDLILTSAAPTKFASVKPAWLQKAQEEETRDVSKDKEVGEEEEEVKKPSNISSTPDPGELSVFHMLARKLGGNYADTLGRIGA